MSTATADQTSSPSSGAPRRGSLLALEVAAYAALTFVSFYPQSVRPWDTVAYIGDPLDTTYFIAWNAHQLYRDPTRLFDANLLFPNPMPMTLAGHRILLGIVLAPVIWATGNAVLAYNVGIGTVSMFTALAGRHLGRMLGLHPVAAWASGALYAFHTFQVNEAPRLDLLLHGFMFLALARLVRYLGTGRARHAWSVAGLMFLQGLASNYLLLYGTLLLALVTAAAMLWRPRATLSRLPGLALPAAAAFALWLPLLVPHIRSAREYDLKRGAPSGIDLSHYFATAKGNRLYGQIGGPVHLQQRAAHFVGFVALGLALLAIGYHAARPDRLPQGALRLSPSAWIPAAAALALLFVALSLGRHATAWGRDLGPGPYRLLHAFVPAFDFIRIPERFAFLAMFFVALLAGRGLHLLSSRVPRAVALLVAALVPLEHVTHLPEARVPEIPAVYDWLAGAPVTAIAEVPVRSEFLVRRETLEEYFSTRHFKPIVHGYVSYPPLLSVLLRRLCAEFPADVSLHGLSRAGVDAVVVHHGRPVGVDLRDAPQGTTTGGSPFARVTRLAGLDLFQKLPEAVASGRLVRLARFEGPDARLFESDADEVYRLVSPPRVEGAPFPRGRRLTSAGWTYRASAGYPRLAADADLRTSWGIAGPLDGDEFFEVTFDRPVTVTGVVLPLGTASLFPTRFRVWGRDAAMEWARLARWDDAHVVQLLDQLLVSPRDARMGFDLGERTLTGLRLQVGESGASPLGWSLPEVEVWGP